MAARKFKTHWFSLDLPRHLTHFTRKTLGVQLEKAGFKVDRMLSTIRPSIIRKSWAYLAGDSGSEAHRRKAKSRFITGLYCKIAHLTGQGSQIFCVASKA